MKTAIIFPGQGSQAVRMGKDFYDTYPLAKDMFDSVDDVLGYKLSDIIFNGPIEILSLTQHAQPAIMTVSAVITSLLLNIYNKKIDDIATMLAGHSLGEYSALFAAGSINITDNAKLLQTRATAMQNACPVGQGSMAACLGLKIDDLAQMINQHINQGICDIANDNTEGQIVISGHNNNIDLMIDVIKSAGCKAVKLNVSAPFHSQLVKPAENIMRDAFHSQYLDDPIIPIISNIDASLTQDTDMIKSKLVQQVSGTVKWRQTMNLMANEGVTRLIEIGPGRILNGLAKKSLHKFEVINLSTVQDIMDFNSLVGESQHWNNQQLPGQSE